MEEKENKGHDHGYDGTDDHSDGSRQEIFSETVRAGKRTYFFDVKSTRAGEYYLTITESKRRFNNDSGKFFYEKHKLFLYKEDFEKFADGLNTTIEFIQENNSVTTHVPKDRTEKDTHVDVEFEDLGQEPTEVSDSSDPAEEGKE